MYNCPVGPFNLVFVGSLYNLGVVSSISVGAFDEIFFTDFSPPFFRPKTRLGTHANSTDPVQTPQNVASDQGLYCLLTGISMQDMINGKTFTSDPRARTGLIK